MEKKGLAFVDLALLLLLISACARPIHSQGTGLQIDLYTERKPYSGRGLNIPSDAFGPGEEIDIYAYVTYNDYPIHGALVAYGVFGPGNSSSKIIFYRSALTDENGTAVIAFRVSYVNEENFGNWTVIGNTDIAGSTVQDTLSFRVGWLVEIVSIRTLNEMNQTHSEFTHQSTVGVELILKNIAMTEKSAMISLMVNDSLNMRVASVEIDNFIVPPNETLIKSYSCFSIPIRAHVGSATISAGPYTAPLTEGGTAYSPEVLAYFMIITRDVAVVHVIPSSQYVRRGESVTIEVGVRNKGWKTESFNVVAYHNGTAIDTLLVADLAPYSDRTLTFHWNTEAEEPGNHLISAYAEPVPDETSLADNTLTDGYVNVGEEVHDVAITGITPSANSVFVDAVVKISVTVKNLGLFNESFNVMVMVNSTIVDALPVTNLEGGTQQTLIFTWDTHGFDEGNYTLSALASTVQGETNTENNQYANGLVELKAQPTQPILFHDVAVIDLRPSSTLVFTGATLDITVVVVNNGNYSESFNVTVYHDSVAIGTIGVSNLNSRTTDSLIFHWNTRNFTEGNYTLSASASAVPEEVDLANNSYTDGTVRLTAPVGSWFVLEWWHLLLLILLLLLIAVLILWLYRRHRKKKNVGGSFDAAWSAWYYGYGVPNRHSET